MSSEEEDYDEGENIRDLEKIRKKKESREWILPKLRNIGQRMKSRIRREHSISSQSTDYDLEKNEDGKSKTVQAESEFTETPMQTTDTISSDQDLVSLSSHFM